MPGRWACGGLQISIVQSAGLLSASSTARSLIAIAVLIGAAANSSSRDHCTRTVRPGWRMRDEGRVERRIVGGVVAVGAGALAVEHGDLRGGEAERAGEPVAQHRRALAVRPDLERAVLELGERAGRADRAIGEERPRVERLDHAALPAPAGLAGVGDRAVARGLRLQPVRRADVGGRRRAALPARQRAGGLGCAHHRDFAVGGEGDEFALAQDLDRRSWRPCARRSRRAPRDARRARAAAARGRAARFPARCRG